MSKCFCCEEHIEGTAERVVCERCYDNTNTDRQHWIDLCRDLKGTIEKHINAADTVNELRKAANGNG